MEQLLSVWGAKGKFSEYYPIILFDHRNAWLEK